MRSNSSWVLNTLALRLLIFLAPQSLSSSAHTDALRTLYKGEILPPSFPNPLVEEPGWLTTVRAETEELRNQTLALRAQTYKPVGIGLKLRRSSQGLKIQGMNPLGPSAASRSIKVGDILQEIDDSNIESLSDEEVADLIAGEEGSVVSLTLKRDGIIFKTVIPRKPASALRPLEPDYHRSGAKSVGGSSELERGWGIGVSLNEDLLVTSIQDATLVGGSEDWEGDDCLQVGDEIISVDGIRITGAPSRKIAGLLCGPEGSEVSLLVLRQSDASERSQLLAIDAWRGIKEEQQKQKQKEPTAGSSSSSQPAASVSLKKIGGFLSGWKKSILG